MNRNHQEAKRRRVDFFDGNHCPETDDVQLDISQYGVVGMRCFLNLAFGFAIVGSIVPANALTIDYDIKGTARPYDVTQNPTLPFTDAGSTPATVVSASTFSFVPGSSFTIGYVSGYTKTTPAYDPAYINGYHNIDGNGAGEPGFYAQQMAYLQDVIGAFATSTGTVVGSPFVFSDGSSFKAPVGATELLLGINDNSYSDNSGLLTVSITASPGLNEVPLPASAPMFGAAIVALGAAGYAAKRKKAATNA